MELKSQALESQATPERGENVLIALKIMRHGERDKVGNLLDLGREITKENARKSGISQDDFDAVKAIGSDAGPKGPTGMQRALETAHLYAEQIAGDEAFKTRINKVLSYENVLSPTPYNHIEVYNSFLPENFDALPEIEKKAASKIAQRETVNHLAKLQSPEALTFKKEVAGSFAYIIEHYEAMTKKIDSGKAVLIPAGTHGGTMEFLLQQALVRKDKDGNTTVGFEDMDSIGGDFDPSDAFTVCIETDEKGNLKPLRVRFDNKERPQEEMYLDAEKVKELSGFYKKVHYENAAKSA